MKIKIDTREDSPDEIRKAIKVLQFLIGDANLPESGSQEISQGAQSAFSTMFSQNTDTQNQGAAQVAPYHDTPAPEKTEGAHESTDSLFADLFSNDEIEQMKHADEEPEEEMPKKEKAEIEFY
ncbi:MAG TPA: hypothetical protein VI564_05495 [Candidatus Nanoarchaeia archaeon]|nr:hypothetical protein [Candidatus Nanoarchaeia archaeon]